MLYAGSSAPNSASLSQRTGDEAIPFTPQPQFILRFKDRPVLEKALLKYHTEPDQAEKAFQSWASSHHSLGAIRLHYVTYAGEAIVVVDGLDETASDLAVRNMEARFLALPEIVYADPDFTAETGSDQ